MGALPGALARAGVDRVGVVLPLYREAREALAARGESLEDTGIVERVALGGHGVDVRFLRLARASGPEQFFAACDAAFDRPGLYSDPQAGRDHGDNLHRFALLCRATVQAGARLLGGVPDILHAHDWQAALAPALVAGQARAWLPHTRTVLTIHNLAYQGVFDAEGFGLTGLEHWLWHPEAAEFHGHLSLLKAGAATADAVTTVSPTYAREIQTPAYGCNLDGFLARIGVVGILNGVDTSVWSPACDPHIAAPFDPADLGGKAACRTALHQACDWDEEPGVMLLGVVGRFAGQKGLDLIADLVPDLHGLGARLVVLGTGEPALEGRFRQLAETYQDNLRVRVAFDEGLSHRIIAGCDALLVPSRFEPCGLTQLYAMAYGTVPVVHAVGGLVDTVEDPGDRGLVEGQGTGFVFRHPSVVGLRWAVERAAGIFRHHPAGWRAIMQAGMARDFSWDGPAQATLALYRRLHGRG